MNKNPSILEVQRAHERAWLGMPGIEGVAIGEQQGKEAIVLLSSLPPENLKINIPTEVDGYAVVIKPAGKIKAR